MLKERFETIDFEQAILLYFYSFYILYPLSVYNFLLKKNRQHKILQ